MDGLHISGTRDAQVFKTFEGHLQKVLEWRKDTKKFIKEFLELQEKHPLILILQDKLKKEIKALVTKPKKPKSKKSMKINGWCTYICEEAVYLT